MIKSLLSGHFSLISKDGMLWEESKNLPFPYVLLQLKWLMNYSLKKSSEILLLIKLSRQFF